MENVDTDLVGAFVAALKDEAQAQRRQGGQAIEVADGRVLDHDLDGGTYRFDLHRDVFLPDGVPVKLAVSEREYQAEVLHREGDWLYLFVNWSDVIGAPPKVIPSASIRAEPWFLHEELARRLETLTGLGVGELLLGRFRDAREGRLLPRPSGMSPQGKDASPVATMPAAAIENRPRQPNLYQRSAIEACVREPLWFVWGPPGTGKTATLGHLVARLAAQGGTVLVTAHANVAVDAATAAVCSALDSTAPGMPMRDRVVRVGPPALPETRQLGVSSRDRALARRPDLATRLRTLEAQLAALAGGRGGRAHPSRKIVAELKEVRAALREEEQGIIATAPILLATLPKTAITEHIYARRFSTVVVDEASMAYPPQVVFVATLAQDRLSIFGDFRQLPPIVVSDHPSTRDNLGRDVFDLAGIVREVDSGGQPADLSMLRIQYRMHPHIRRLVSEFAYGGQLEDGSDVAGRTQTFANLPPREGEAVVVLDTSAFGAVGWRDHEGKSRWNPAAAAWAFRTAYELASGGAEDVALLTPYRPQAALFSALVRGFQAREKIAVGTVHRFQGAERAVVVLDLTDAPPLPLPGLPLQHASGQRLMTVAASRARGKLLVFAHRQLLERPNPSRDMLHRCQLTAVAERPRDLLVATSLLQWVPTLDEAQAELQAELDRGLSWCWLPSKVPTSLRRMVSKVPEPRSAPDDQALVITAEGVWLFMRQSQWFAIRVRDAGVARAVWQVLEGSRIPTELRVQSHRKEDAEPAPTLGLPLCGCGSPMVVELAGQDWSGPVIQCVCPRCKTERPAAADDLTRWAYVMKQKCPVCRGAVVGRRGEWGLFLGCSKFPRCRGTIKLKDVL